MSWWPFGNSEKPANATTTEPSDQKSSTGNSWLGSIFGSKSTKPTDSTDQSQPTPQTQPPSQTGGGKRKSKSSRRRKSKTTRRRKTRKH